MGIGVGRAGDIAGMARSYEKLVIVGMARSYENHFLRGHGPLLQSLVAVHPEDFGASVVAGQYPGDHE